MLHQPVIYPLELLYMILIFLSSVISCLEISVCSNEVCIPKKYLDIRGDTPYNIYAVQKAGSGVAVGKRSGAPSAIILVYQGENGPLAQLVRAPDS